MVTNGALAPRLRTMLAPPSPMTASVLAFVSFTASFAGCAAHDDAHAHGALAVDAGSSTLGDASLEEDRSLASPEVTRAIPMGDGVHVTRSNPVARCEAVRGERSREGGPWVAAFRVDGALDNLHDGGLQKGALYTYRVRCEIGGRMSPPSNEASAYD
jgi:hypothetical protein